MRLSSQRHPKFSLKSEESRPDALELFDMNQGGRNKIMNDVHRDLTTRLGEPKRDRKQNMEPIHQFTRGQAYVDPPRAGRTHSLAAGQKTRKQRTHNNTCMGGGIAMIAKGVGRSRSHSVRIRFFVSLRLPLLGCSLIMGPLIAVPAAHHAAKYRFFSDRRLSCSGRGFRGAVGMSVSFDIRHGRWPAREPTLRASLRRKRSLQFLQRKGPAARCMAL